MARRRYRRKKNTFAKMMAKYKLDLSSETKRGIAVTVFIVLSGVTLLSVLGVAGSLGGFILDTLKVLFGVGAYLIPILFVVIAVILFKSDADEDYEDERHPYFRTYVGVFLIIGSFAGLLHSYQITDTRSAFAVANEGSAGGYLGALFSGPLVSLLGFWATGLILFGLLLIAILVTLDVSPFVAWEKIMESFGKVKEKVPTSSKKDKVQINSLESEDFVQEDVANINEAASDAAEEYEDEEVEYEEAEEEEYEDEENPEPTVINTNTAPAAGDIAAMESITLEDRRDWKLPPFELLNDNKTSVDSGNIENNVEIIQKALSDFGIEVEMGEVNVGPTVTQYTLRPATGVKLSQIASLQNDLALALAAHSIRMELPIPGRALVGIEVPNKSTAIVRLREVMQTNEFVKNEHKLSLALGRDVAGKPMLANLAKMPHMMIAGATGTGKSVGINSLLISLLYRNTPQDVKFILVDPKRVELSIYNGIPHLLTPAITEPEKAVNALKWAVAEMDRRYKLLAEAGKRNIIDYNKASELELPYIVIVIDELADLMAVAQQEVESAIVRLAQMARAVGIHLVLATQRPSVEVITGLIKANITSRIAFAVSSSIDSRTILDASGAEKLLGNGDMLFTSAEFNKPRRVQGAFIDEPEVRKVVDFFKEQAGAIIYNEEIVEKPSRSVSIPGVGDIDPDGDELIPKAIEEVTRAGKASASLLQRRLRVGYARAARLLDMLEEQGIVGPANGAKPRDVFTGGIPDSEKEEYGVEE